MASKSTRTRYPGVRRRETADGPVFDWEIPQRGVDPQGKPHRKLRGTERTEQAAVAAKAVALAKRNQNRHVVARHRVTVASYIKTNWLPLRAELATRGTIEFSTLDRNERDVKNRILPYIGHIELELLSTRDIDTMVTTLLTSGRRVGSPEAVAAPKRHHEDVYCVIKDLRTQGMTYANIAELIALTIEGEDGITRQQVSSIWWRMNRPPPETTGRNADPGLAPQSVKGALTLIRQILEDAVNADLLERNVARKAAPVPDEKFVRPPEQWDAEQTKRFFEWLRRTGDLDYFVLRFIANSADRRSANLALRWIDVSWETRNLHFVWSLTSPNQQDKVRWVKPWHKADANHVIHLDRHTEALLRAWRKIQDGQRALYADNVHACDDVPGFAAGSRMPLRPKGMAPSCIKPGYHDRSLVFCAPDGDFYRPSTVTKKFQRHQTRYNHDHPDAQLPKIHLHALRGGWSSTAETLAVSDQDRANHLHHSVRVNNANYTRKRQPNARERAAAEAVVGAFMDDDGSQEPVDVVLDNVIALPLPADGPGPDEAVK